MTEEVLLRYCAPTLAGVKTASLFRHTFPSRSAMLTELRHWNRQLCRKGLRILPLQWNGNAALIYLYRPQALKNDFGHFSVSRLMASYGYPRENPARCLAQLMKRLHQEQGFPHEIGLFLGYPPEDVQGFIEHRPCKYTGCWKVYGDVEQAKRTFASYQQCTSRYLRRWAEGIPVEHLARNEHSISPSVSSWQGAQCEVDYTAAP